MATRAKNVYASDISYGSTPFRRGHWANRLSMIDQDVAALENYFSTNKFPSSLSHATISQPSPRPVIAAEHLPPEAFHPGSDLSLTLTTLPGYTAAILWYRHVNHGERWRSTPMQSAAATHTAAIPAAYTASPYPLQYYFELHTVSSAGFHPALNETLSNQPYFAIHHRT